MKTCSNEKKIEKEKQIDFVSIGYFSYFEVGQNETIWYFIRSHFSSSSIDYLKFDGSMKNKIFR